MRLSLYLRLKQSKILIRFILFTQEQLVGSIKVDLTVNFHHEHFIDPTNCHWVSEDELGSTFDSNVALQLTNFMHEL